MSLFTFAAFAMGNAPAVSLQGGTITSIVTDPSNAEAGIRVNATGILEQFITPSWTQLASGTDWIRPTYLASSDYDCRVTNVVGTAFTTASAADDVWIDCGTTRQWRLFNGDVGTLTVTFDLEIRDPAGATVASTSYTLTSIVDPAG